MAQLIGAHQIMSCACQLRVILNMASLALAGMLLGCAAKVPVSPPEQVCLFSSSWRSLEAPPWNAVLLYKDVADRPGLVDASENSRDYWFESNNGSLRLCRQRVDARDVCGSANVEFNLVEGRWVPQFGVDVAVCGA